MHYFSLHRLWSALLTLGRAGALQTLGSVPWLGIFMAGSSVFAQTAGKQPSERDAVNSRPTKDVTVVESASVPFGTVVAFGDEVRAKLKDAMYPRIERFPLSRDKAVDLELERFWVTSPGAQFVVGTDQGDRPLSPPDVALFKGEVAGQPDSRVFLSVRPDGSNGFVYLNGEEFVISNLKGKRAGLPANSHLVFSRADTKPFAPQAAFDCEALTPPGQVEEVATELATVATVVTRQANVAFDCDYEFRQMFANLAEATAYVIELAGAVSTIYEDDIAMRLNASFIRVWDTAADPYVATNTSGALEELRTHWNSTMTSVPRNTVHMLSGKNSGGGIAYVNQMCGGQYAYGVSGSLNGTFPTPIHDADWGNWDLIVVAHELGHNFRSPHTHCYNPPVDQCYSGGGGSCWSGATVCQQGTIMSYCHVCGGLDNIDLTFGPTVSSYIQGGLQACIGTVSVASLVYVDWRNAGPESGSVTQPYNTVTEGLSNVVSAGTVSIASGGYSEEMTISQPVTLTATGGAVSIGQ